jgi:aldehyde oxidoreductase
MFNKLRPKYEEAKKRCKALSTPEKRRGVGLALGIYGSGLDGADSSEASVELTKDGNVIARNTWQDHGQAGDLGTVSFVTRRCARWASENIICDQHHDKPNSGSGGSRQNVMTGHSHHRQPDTYEGDEEAQRDVLTYEEMVRRRRSCLARRQGSSRTARGSAPTPARQPVLGLHTILPARGRGGHEDREVKVVKFTTVADGHDHRGHGGRQTHGGSGRHRPRLPRTSRISPSTRAQGVHPVPEGHS